MTDHISRPVLFIRVTVVAVPPLWRIDVQTREGSGGAGVLMGRKVSVLRELISAVTLVTPVVSFLRTSSKTADSLGLIGAVCRNTSYPHPRA